MSDTQAVAPTHTWRDSRRPSRRTSLLIAAAAWVLALSAAIVHNRVSPLLPERVHVRWSEAASPDQRIQVEHELGLASGEQEQGRTWSYVLRDVSTTNIGRLVRHPFVEDTHYIDRATATLSVDASGQPEWARSLAQVSAVQMAVRWLPTIALMLTLIGVAGAWPIWRSLSVAIWSRVQHPISTTRAALLVRARDVRHATQAQIRDIQINGLSARGRTALALALIMLVSLLLRIQLVLSGGQFYWGDESRYTQARDIAGTLEHGDILYAFNRMGNGQHPLFSVVGVIPALVERATHEDPRIPAAFFATFSTLNIGLLALIARRSGATYAEALGAGALLALCNSMFFYARHLLPYDVAMSFGLLALSIGVGHGGRPSSIVCGVAAACAFLTYLGYWTFGGVALVIHVVNAESRKAALRRVLFGGVGLVGTIGGVILGSALAGENLVRALRAFSGQVDQGDFREGWRLPWEYLWHAEHFMIVLWAVSLVWTIAAVRSRALSRSARIGLIGFVFVYGVLVTTSVVTHTFVVYGRLARQLVPFLCLMTAAVLYRTTVLVAPRGRRLVWSLAAVLLVAQAAFNFTTPLRQVFPAEFLRDAHRLPGAADLVAVNAKHFYPGPEPVTLPPRYTVVRRAPHPLQFLPYQYEGYPPSQRAALRSADIEMKLLLVMP